MTFKDRLGLVEKCKTFSILQKVQNVFYIVNKKKFFLNTMENFSKFLFNEIS